MALSWEELELPILGWALHAGDEGTGELRRGAAEPFDGAPDVTEAQAEEALTRLEEFGLVVGDRIETSDFTEWSRVRPTANGLRVLGEWPPEESATLQQALVAVLLSVADDLPEPEARPVRRAAGGLARFAGGVVSDVARGELKRLGGEPVS